MAQKKLTSETLAEIINEGFKTTATKEDLKVVTTRLDGIDSRLARIEYLLLAEQKWEIENLKQRMKRLDEALAV
jgi:hypothetical protein